MLEAVRGFRYRFAGSIDWDRVHDTMSLMPGLKRISMDCGGSENKFVDEQMRRGLPGGSTYNEGGWEMFRWVVTWKDAAGPFPLHLRSVVRWVEEPRLSTLTWLEIRSHNGMMEKEWLTVCLSRGQQMFPHVETLILGGLPETFMAGCLLQDFLIMHCQHVGLVQVDNGYRSPPVRPEEIMGFTRWPSSVRHLKIPWRFWKGEIPSGLVSISIVRLEDVEYDDINALLGASGGVREVSFVHAKKDVSPEVLLGVCEHFVGLRRIHICVRYWKQPNAQVSTH